MSLQKEIENHLLKHYNAPIDKNASYLINKILGAAWPDIKTMQQALLEMKHAQSAGPGWYTRGESGLKQQVRMWLDKGLKASESLNKLRGLI